MKTTIQVNGTTYKRIMQFGDRNKKNVQKSRRVYDRNRIKRNDDII